MPSSLLVCLVTEMSGSFARGLFESYVWREDRGFFNVSASSAGGGGGRNRVGG